MKIHCVNCKDIFHLVSFLFSGIIQYYMDSELARKRCKILYKNVHSCVQRVHTVTLISGKNRCVCGVL